MLEKSTTAKSLMNAAYRLADRLRHEYGSADAYLQGVATGIGDLAWLLDEDGVDFGMNRIYGVAEAAGLVPGLEEVAQ